MREHRSAIKAYGTFAGQFYKPMYLRVHQLMANFDKAKVSLLHILPPSMAVLKRRVCCANVANHMCAFRTLIVRR